MTGSAGLIDGRLDGLRARLPRTWVGVALSLAAFVASLAALTSDLDSPLFVLSTLTVSVIEMVLFIYWAFCNLRLIEVLSGAGVGERLPRPWTAAVVAVFANHLTTAYVLMLATPVLWGIFTLAARVAAGQHPALMIALLSLAGALPLLAVVAAATAVVAWYVRLFRLLSGACAELMQKPAGAGTIYGAMVGAGFVTSSIWTGFNADPVGPETLPAMLLAVSSLMTSLAYLAAFLSARRIAGWAADGLSR